MTPVAMLEIVLTVIGAVCLWFVSTVLVGELLRAVGESIGLGEYRINTLVGAWVLTYTGATLLGIALFVL